MNELIESIEREISRMERDMMHEDGDDYRVGYINGLRRAITMIQAKEHDDGQD